LSGKQSWYNSLMNKHPLYIYVIATVVVWIIILGLMSALGHMTAFQKTLPVCAGFFIGMLAMYIAVHLYRWK